MLAGAELPWRTVDLRGLGEVQQHAALAELLAADVDDRFDAGRAPLIRLTLVRAADDRAELVLSAHHAVLDGWSLGILVAELLALYADDNPLPPAPAYQDYLRWLAAANPEAAMTAWSAELAGIEEPTLVGTGGGLDRQQTEQHTVPLTAGVARELARRAAEFGVTLNTVVQAAWAVALAGLTGRQDVVFGSTVSSRPSEVPGIESMVGLFINTIPVRVRLRPWDTLGTVLTTLQARQNALVEYRHCGLAELQNASGLRTLFDTATVFESVPMGLDASGELAVTGVRTSGGTHYPIGVAAAATPQLGVMLHIQPGAVDSAVAARAVDSMAAALRQIAADPSVAVGRVDLLGPTERARLVSDDTTVPLAEATVAELFARQLAATPDATAIRCGKSTWSYRDLDARAGLLARRLVSHGVGPETVVAVSLPRSAELVVAMLAVWQAGGVYLPVDAGYPSERIAHLIENAHARLAMVDGTTTAAFAALAVERLAVDGADVSGEAAGGPDSEAARLRHPPDDTGLGSCTTDNAAYVIYTSGSTGQPKGVVVTHRGIASLVHAHAERLAIGPDTRMLQLLSPSFDVSICEVLTTLLHGGCLVVEPDGELALGEPLARTDRPARRDPCADDTHDACRTAHRIDVIGDLDRPWRRGAVSRTDRRMVDRAPAGQRLWADRGHRGHHDERPTRLPDGAGTDRPADRQRAGVRAGLEVATGPGRGRR